jgi:hypothetical protein
MLLVPKRFTQQPFNTISLHRTAVLTADGQADPTVRQSVF